MKLSVARQSWPIAGTFRIARGAKTEAQVVVVTLTEGRLRGWGECVPYARYGETVEGVAATLEALASRIGPRTVRQDLYELLPAGAARNALDCALWDLEAKRAATSVWQLAGLRRPGVLQTAFTLSLDEPGAMAAAAAKAAVTRPLLKLKLGAEGDPERLLAIRAATPNARLIVDANEGWRPGDLDRLFAVCQQVGVELVEQPLPAGDDEALRSIDRPIPVCADESFHDSASLPQLVGKYDAVNVKLDKTGGLTEALRASAAARGEGLAVMVGCMVATSLAMAPAMLVAQEAAFVDLDGPLLLSADRSPGLAYQGADLQPACGDLWGGSVQSDGYGD